jgi:orotate phosphoribosyltransferase
MALRWSDLSILERTRVFFKLEGVFNRSVHWWRRGRKEAFYFDFDSIVYEPAKCADVVALLLSYIREFQGSAIDEPPVSYLAFIEKRDGGTIGALSLAAALSLESGIPFCVVRPGKFVVSERVKTPFIRGVAPNHRLNDERCLIITDHCTTGGEVIEAAKCLRAVGAAVAGALAYTVVTTDPQDAESREESFRREELPFTFCHSLPEDAERPVDIEVYASV